MKIVMSIVGAAVLGGGMYLHGPRAEPNVYPLSFKDTYAKLRKSTVEETEGSKAAGVTTTISGDPNKYVMWSTRGSHVALDCKAHLIAVDANTTKIIPECEGGSASDGAAAGMVMNMSVNAFIERIDSVMTDRPYDKKLAMGSTAASWPKQEIANADLFSAQNEALKMQAEMQAQMAEMESSSE
jgi:hypothetical protein